MRIEVKVPVFSESVSEGTLLEWQKQVGQAVKRDDPLIDIETDKVVLEVVALEDGVLTEIVVPGGTNVVSEQVIAVIDTDAVATVTDEAGVVGESAAPAQAASPSAQSAATGVPSPAARKMIADNALDAATIVGSGKDGRITKEDVADSMKSGVKSQPATAAAYAPAAPASGDRQEERVPMSRIRQRIAERLLSAQQNAAILTTFNEVDLQPVMELRNRYKSNFERKYGVRLGFMSFFVKAAVEALREFPLVNASIDGNDLIYHNFFDIGIAVSSPRGLVVPILRNAEHMSFAEIEGTVSEFGEKATENRLSIEELTGGTFSISNGGIFGSMLSTPILNPPQSAILGMHKIQERPMVLDGEIVIRPMMYLALSYDHRVVDGREAVSFLVTIKNMLEDPARLLLEI
ncbi:MAG: 2-oxoglutarate dehydrogenase complex dihydrolipoyllysine-residue succinyltransferase [Gammaproteobacteria bacterium]|nr:2-oxoglutarate dehydrogenase complex dihydrolipoyllysine-residue succinyltransferase [Gammaproteobacteria bacterium]